MIKIILLAGVLSYGPLMPQVLTNRQSPDFSLKQYSLPTNLPHYDCLLGIRWGYVQFLGDEVFVRTEDGKVYGPYLIVDYENPKHAPSMKNNGLAADIDCPALVHKRVELLVEVRRGLKK